jgi:hypothetical protein
LLASRYSLMAMTGFDRTLLEEKLQDAEQRLHRSEQHILVLDSQIKELEILYKRAQKWKKNASRYNLRLKLSVVSGEYFIFLLNYLPTA